ncbi:MAG: hypothetical protein ACYDCO_03945 [Armatimonadota bacterium]
MKKLFVLGFAVALACAAYAYPTLNGPTGLVFVPTAAVAPAGQLQVALDWAYFSDFEDADIPLRVLYGINDQFEIGAAYFSQEGNEDNAFGINGKFVLPFTAGDAAWAVGASFFDSDDDDSSFGLSLSATKAFTEGFAGTAALLWDEDDEFALGIGAEANFDSGLTLVGEYINFLPSAELNMAARYPITEALTAQLGFAFDTEATFIGAMYAFGGAE